MLVASLPVVPLAELLSNPRMTADELIDYLTMLSWSALCGIVEVGGSLEKFREQPHPSPIVPPRLLDK